MLAAATLTGCAATPAPTPTVTGVAVPDVVGMPGDDARSALTAAGLLVQFDGGDDMVLMPSNWTVQGQDPGAGERAEKGATVVVRVSKPEPTRVAVPATTDGLTATNALSACDSHGRNQFPYGWDPHWIIGMLAEEVRPTEVYLKVTADVTNEFNAEREVNVECYVTGTDEAPTVRDFIAY